MPIELVASSTTLGRRQALDNDVGPAARAGMVAVFVRRRPWAWIQAGRSAPSEAAVVLESLIDLPGALAAPQ